MTKLDFSRLAPDPWTEAMASVPGGALRALLERLRASGVRLVWRGDPLRGGRGWRLQPAAPPTVEGWASLGAKLGVTSREPARRALLDRLEMTLGALDPPPAAEFGPLLRSGRLLRRRRPT